MEHIVTCMPSQQEAFPLPFYEQPRPYSPLDIANRQYTNYVFSDLPYRFQLPLETCQNLDESAMEFFVNDAQVSAYVKDGLVDFVPEHSGFWGIFQDCYGFVELKLNLSYVGKPEPITLYSEPIPVMIRDNALNQSVKSMAEYIFRQEESLLRTGKQIRKSALQGEEEDSRSLEAQISLAREIWFCYEESFDYFRANCRFRMKEVQEVDSLEKLAVITPHTLQFMAEHPEYLAKTGGNYGIVYENQRFLPEKTLVSQNIFSRDTYENRVVVQFLKTVTQALLDMKDTVRDISAHSIQNSMDGYVSSYASMVELTLQSLAEQEGQIDDLLERFQSLLLNYHQIMEFDPNTPDFLYSTPQPSAILLSVPQYKKIYTKIYQWFHFDVYAFTTEKYLLSMVKISDLYESYLVAKHLDYFQQAGWKELERRSFAYPLAESQWEMRENFCDNTFIFEKGSKILTFYHQPVLYNRYRHGQNDLGLYRNTSITYRDESKRGGYYVPDFVFKMQEGDRVDYIIGDAKFSQLDTVKATQIPALTFKYLFSLGTSFPKERIIGLVVYYGKCSGENQAESVYDRKPCSYEILPFAQLIPMMENEQKENHMADIAQILRDAPL